MSMRLCDVASTRATRRGRFGRLGPTSAAGLGLAATLTTATVGCLTLDIFFFGNVAVDEYRWDDDDPCDPLLLGELAEVEHARNGGPAPSCHPSRVPPEDRVEGFVPLQDGTEIHYVFAHRADAKATIFYSHGTGRHIGRYWDRVELMWSMGYHVMIYDYPGYGRSQGEPDEAGVFAAAEAVLEQVLPTMPDVDLDRVYLMGYSLGGAPTYELALRADEGRLTVRPRGVVSEATFCSTEALIQDGARLDLPGEFLSANPFDNCAKIGALDPATPVMIIHGTADTFVVPWHAELLVDAARPAVELHWAEGADHSEIPVVMGQTYIEWLDTFFVDHLPVDAPRRRL